MFQVRLQFNLSPFPSGKEKERKSEITCGYSRDLLVTILTPSLFPLKELKFVSIGLNLFSCTQAPMTQTPCCIHPFSLYYFLSLKSFNNSQCLSSRVCRSPVPIRSRPGEKVELIPMVIFPVSPSCCLPKYVTKIFDRALPVAV